MSDTMPRMARSRLSRGRWAAAGLAGTLTLTQLAAAIFTNFATAALPKFLESEGKRWVLLTAFAVLSVLLSMWAARGNSGNAAKHPNSGGVAQGSVSAGAAGTAIGSISGNSGPVFVGTTILSPDTDDRTLDQAAEMRLGALLEIELMGDGDLPRVRDLDPYQLGATSSDYGGIGEYGVRDPYVERTHRRVDAAVRSALGSGQLTVVYGPSKAGKTRTAFQAVLETRPEARIAVPSPEGLPEFTLHPRFQTTNDPLVVWLDDIDRYLATEALSPTTLSRLRRRGGATALIGTLRTEARELLRASGELSRADRLVMSAAIEVELLPTDEDPDEQAAAAAAYPDEDLGRVGLAEQLAGAPALWAYYRDLRYSLPLEYAVIEVNIDWARVGLRRPLPAKDLSALTKSVVDDRWPEREATEQEILEAIRAARTPLRGHGRAVALVTHILGDGSRAYRPFEYLLAGDDGQSGEVRPIAENFLVTALRYTLPSEAHLIAKTAYERNMQAFAIVAAQYGANAGDRDAMNSLGILLYENDPPDLGEAEIWLRRSVALGSIKALNNLGQLELMRESPNPDAALNWYIQAANAGSTMAIGNVIALLQGRRNVPDVGVHGWLERAQEIVASTAADGNIEAMVGLGHAYSMVGPLRDLEEASRLFAAAAAVGNIAAMNNLGYLYARLQEPPDLDRGIYWLTKAAQRGYDAAMINLYTIYSRITPDAERASYWLSRAKVAGVDDIEAEQRRLDRVGEDRRNWLSE